MIRTYKNFYIETYGCQMNFSLSEQLSENLKKRGYNPVFDFKEADIVIINACSVREHAEKKVFQKINYYNSQKIKKDFKLIVTGCFAQNQKNNIKADMVLGTYHIKDIPELIEKNVLTKFDISMNKYNFMEPVPEEGFEFRSMVDITVGCDNFCTYCIVPYVRGPQISRSSKEILEIIKRLVEKGVVEVTLLGQNVNSYGIDNKDISFAELLHKISTETDIKRIKFLTSHPKDFNDDIIDAIFSIDKVSKYIHLPIQSGSDNILRKMNRKYSVEHYLSIIEKIRNYNKEFSLSTDILIGFPGESEKDFMETIDIIKQIRYDEAYMFKYSPRPNTASLLFGDTVSEEEKKERLNYLITVQKNIEKEDIKKHLNRKRRVLVENISKKNEREFIGRDELNKVVILKDKVQIGNFYDVFIEDVKGVTLIGKI